MKIGVIGISHDTATVAQRETYAKSQTLNAIKEGLSKVASVDEFAILSTCGRFEIYYAVKAVEGEAVKQVLINEMSLSQRANMPLCYVKEDAEAARHLFQVACGLDSAVLGEDQILGQVKNAIAAANEAEQAGKILNKLFREAVSFSKWVKTQFKFSENPLSLSYIAVKKAGEAGRLTSACAVTMVGLGKMGTLAIKYLLESPVLQITLAIRSPEKLPEEILCHPKVRIASFESRYVHIAESDLVVASTAAPHTVIRKDQLMGYKPHALWIDLAMPRDIEPEIAEMKDLEVWYVDHLKDISEANYQKRTALSLEINEMMCDRIDAFVIWITSLEMDDVFRGWQSTIQTLTEEAMTSIKRRPLADSEKSYEKIEQILASTLKKMVKQPLENLKGIEDKQKRDQYIGMLKTLYNYE